MSEIQWFGNAVLVLAAIPANLFLLFFLRNKWETSQMGRQTMALAFSMALILDLVLFRQIIGDSPLYAAVRLVAFALIVPTLWWRFFLLLSSQRGARGYGRVTMPAPPTPGGRMTTEPEDVLELEAPDVQETTLPPTGEPSDDWDQEVHAEEYAEDPEVSTDKED